MADLLLRGAGLGTLALIALIFATQVRASRGGVSVPVLALMIACYLVVSAPSAATLPDPVRAAIVFGATIAPVGLAWALLDLLTDPPHPRWPWLITAVLTVPAAYADQFWPLAGVVRGGLVLALYLGLLALALVSDSDDLVPSRRRFRRAVLVLMLMLGLIITTVEVSGLDNALPAWVFLLQGGSILVLALGFATWALRAAPDLINRQTPKPSQSPELADRAVREMQDGAWRTEGLTIGAFAQNLGVPEHRLRRAINGDLGFRNFSSFVNGYRIASAMAALADPAQSGKTILEIAYECGFASVGPFNRAFRAQTGQSPTEFRSNPTPIPENPGRIPQIHT